MCITVVWSSYYPEEKMTQIAAKESIEALKSDLPKFKSQIHQSLMDRLG
jgi:hypothetical protein